MAKATTYQCPNCNGILVYNVQENMLVCMHCGGSFSENEVNRAIPLSSVCDEGQIEHVKTVEGFLEHAPWEASGTNAANAVEYSCPSCGSNVIADRSAVTAQCPYCGNNMLVSGIATPDTIPQKVIPFSITREDAMAQMQKHFRRKWYLSRKFWVQIEHLQGVYVPYHLYNLRVSGWANYIGNNEISDGKGNRTAVSYRALHRAGYADIAHMPIDGSSKMPDGHMDAIAPFDFAKMRDFSTSYVAGFLAEVPDESAEECLPRADARARESFAEKLGASAREVDKVDSIETIESNTDVEVARVTTCMLPVWLMHCTWEDNQMLFAVNGDSGKCVGDLPIDKSRRTVTMIIATIVTLIIAIPLFRELLADPDMPKIMFIIAFALFAIPFTVDEFFKGQMKTAVEAKGDGLDYSTEGLVITENWNGPKFHVNRNKALDDLRNRE